MVLLEEEPSKLLAALAANFDITSDTRAVARINDELATLRAARAKQADELRSHLRLLTRKADVAEQSVASSEAALRARNHGANMVALDREKFALAKSVNEIESNTHALEGQLARLREELEEVDAEDPEERAVLESEDGTLLKLKVYRSLGIDVQEDGAGGYNKAVIRNPNKGDVHVVNIENKFSPFFYANYFWNVI
ncbi:Spc24 subunit of Ndc80-domain-containing protein [Geopyxis carbonaria]|nr:Spc24 subunit of Ndc80-domain-containing protein [Geopyxis carbonaria]